MRNKDASFYRRKAAMADLIERCGGPTRAARHLDCSQQLMSRVKDRDDPTVLTGEAKLGLEAECGEPLLTRVEAELLGFDLVPLGERRALQGCPHAASAGLAVEVTELFTGYAERMRDGDFSRADAMAVDRDLAEVIRQAEFYRGVLAARIAGPPS